MVGIAPGARLWALKVAGEDGLAYASNVMCAQDWMATHTFIKVINFSFAGPDYGFKETCSDGYTREGFCHLNALGITTFVAAGNEAADASNYAPAQFPEVITVSAISDYDGKPGGLAGFGDDEFASFSNYGKVVDLAAPGDSVETTSVGGGYEFFTGTSGASPTVAGAAALIVAQQGLSGRDLILQRLILSSQPGAIPGDPDGYHEPLINVAQLGAPPDDDEIERLSGRSNSRFGGVVSAGRAGDLPLRQHVHRRGDRWRRWQSQPDLCGAGLEERSAHRDGIEYAQDHHQSDHGQTEDLGVQFEYGRWRLDQGDDEGLSER